jgi:hypothetical protein
MKDQRLQYKFRFVDKPNRKEHTMAKRKKKPQVGPDFMRRTQFQNLEPSGQQRGMPPPMPELPFQGETIDLPDPKSADLQSIDLAKAIEDRKSERVFLEGTLSLNELSYLTTRPHPNQRRHLHLDSNRWPHELAIR